MDLSQFADEIKKTGFELEFRVSECLRRHGWTVISNKFYVDDVQGAVREIDLVAYKTAKVQHLRVVTTMVVSCKRSERDAWVILAKAAAPGDPNIDWQPLHAWSNDRALQYMISSPGWPASFVSSANEHGCSELQVVPTRQETFARIHFLTPSKLENAVAAYDKLHLSNQVHFAATCDRFYDGVLKDDQRKKVFLEDVRSDLSWRLAWRLEKFGVREVSPDSIGLSWALPGEAVVDLSFAGENIDAINADTSLRQALSAVLKKYYRYEGPSRFNDDIPF